MGGGISFRKSTENINTTKNNKTLELMRTAAAATGKASKSATPAPVKVQHTKNAKKVRRHKVMMRFTAPESTLTEN